MVNNRLIIYYKNSDLYALRFIALLYYYCFKSAFYFQFVIIKSKKFCLLHVLFDCIYVLSVTGITRHGVEQFGSHQRASNRILRHKSTKLYPVLLNVQRSFKSEIQWTWQLQVISTILSHLRKTNLMK